MGLTANNQLGWCVGWRGEGSVDVSTSRRVSDVEDTPVSVVNNTGSLSRNRWTSRWTLVTRPGVVCVQSPLPPLCALVRVTRVAIVVRYEIHKSADHIVDQYTRTSQVRLCRFEAPNTSETNCNGNLARPVVPLEYGAKYYAAVTSTSATDVVKIRATLETNVERRTCSVRPHQPSIVDLHPRRPGTSCSP